MNHPARYTRLPVLGLIKTSHEALMQFHFDHEKKEQEVTHAIEKHFPDDGSRPPAKEFFVRLPEAFIEKMMVEIETFIRNPSQYELKVVGFGEALLDGGNVEVGEYPYLLMAGCIACYVLGGRFSLQPKPVLVNIENALPPNKTLQ